MSEATITGELKGLWPRGDYSRVPFRFYHDPHLYREELERIFGGPTWSYLCLEAEIPAPGDFRTTLVGETPVVVTRKDNGEIAAFVNRCAHRGAIVRREAYGNAREHICVYHRWSYAQDGSLTGVPFRRGVGGKGGMPEDFDPKANGLQKLKVQSLRGVVFGTFAPEVETLADYLGPVMTAHIERLMHKPIRILGYQRQTVFGNWKLYMENVRDSYHGGLLHEFQNTFGISRVTQVGGARMDSRHRHHVTYSSATEAPEGSRLHKDAGVANDRLQLSDARLLEYVPEFADGQQLTISSVFPNAVFQQIRNCLATRQLRPRGVDEFDLVFTIYGYADDTPEMVELRLAQSNMIGPAGYISMEDGEAIELVHRATRGGDGRSGLLEMGGLGAIPDEIGFRTSEVSIRGFWSYYAALMNMEPDGAPR
jgi:anthranilate 1,2-dioxygenase large subunit